MELRARAEAAENPRYRWLGERSRDETLSILRGSRLMALTSRLEGGANVLSEAIVAQVPVVSSRIDGSVGILGATYPGFFPSGDTAALSALMHRAETDLAFVGDLARRCAALEPLFSRDREKAAWAALLRMH
jgi:glycosyltransferase involved in cell wall biosynthesis